MSHDQKLISCIRYRARKPREFARRYPELEKLFEKHKPFCLEDQLQGLPVTTHKMRNPFTRLIKQLKKFKTLLHLFP